MKRFNKTGLWCIIFFCAFVFSSVSHLAFLLFYHGIVWLNSKPLEPIKGRKLACFLSHWFHLSTLFNIYHTHNPQNHCSSERVLSRHMIWLIHMKLVFSLFVVVALFFVFTFVCLFFFAKIEENLCKRNGRSESKASKKIQMNWNTSVTGKI